MAAPGGPGLSASSDSKLRPHSTPLHESSCTTPAIKVTKAWDAGRQGPKMLLTRLNRMVVLLPLSYSCQLFNDIIYVYHWSFVQCVCKQLHSELQGLRHKPW